MQKSIEIPSTHAAKLHKQSKINEQKTTNFLIITPT